MTTLHLHPPDSGGRQRSGVPKKLLAAAISLILAAVGCDGSGNDQLFSTDQTGEVEIQAFMDLDRSGAFGAGDRPLSGVEIGLRFPGTVDTVALGTTNAVGEIEFDAVAVGSLELFGETAHLSDSLVVSLQDPEAIRVIRGSQVSARFALSYPIVKIEQARQWAESRRIFVDGVAVNATGELPGAALHVWDGSGWLRAEATTGPTINAGDSVRLRGVIRRDGESAVLREAVRFQLPGNGDSVDPVEVSTEQARTAGAGLDGALVRITGAGVAQAVFQGGTATVQATDGSGPIFVQIPAAHLVDARLPVPSPGGVLNVTGVLIPLGGTSWELRTRRGTDVTILSTGAVSGRVFIPSPDEGDDNASEAGDMGLQETPLAGVRVLMRAAQIGGDIIGEATTDFEGNFRIEQLPTGPYEVELDPFTYPDTLSLGEVSPTPVLVRHDETIDVSVPLLPSDGS